MTSLLLPPPPLPLPRRIRGVHCMTVRESPVFPSILLCFRTTCTVVTQTGKVMWISNYFVPKLVFSSTCPSRKREEERGNVNKTNFSLLSLLLLFRQYQSFGGRANEGQTGKQLKIDA